MPSSSLTIFSISDLNVDCKLFLVLIIPSNYFYFLLSFWICTYVIFLLSTGPSANIFCWVNNTFSWSTIYSHITFYITAQDIYLLTTTSTSKTKCFIFCCKFWIIIFESFWYMYIWRWVAVLGTVKLKVVAQSASFFVVKFWYFGTI